MKKMPFLAPFFVVASLLAGCSGSSGTSDEPKAPARVEAKGQAGVLKRVPWTTSRIIGSPDPPLSYKIQPAFPKLKFQNPLLLTRMPGTGRFVVGENAGKLYSFPNNRDVAKADLFLDLTTEIHSWKPESKVSGVGAVYGLAFHPRFPTNRTCYVCYVLNGKNGEQLRDGTRVSRFRVTETIPPRCDPKSEEILITWLAGGHNGGDLHFGPDGFLYISAGDGADPNPPDRFDTGQDLSDLLSSILRIDVDHADPGKPYAVPPDNPFVHTPGARPEIWAYGLRNPWRMSFDRATGDLWVGDVGWETWEMVYRIRRGGNYGWSVMEGRQAVRPESKRGPTAILPPTLDFPHSEAASITGGYVYRGKKFKDLAGAYICGDWMTRKVWGTRFEGDRVVWHKELAQGSGRIVAFGEDDLGEQYIVFYDEPGTIQQLVPNPARQVTDAKFPTKLSESGLFASVKDCTPAPGVVPFSINAEQWADHASAERWLALPGTATVRIHDEAVPVPGTAFYTGKVFFPKDGVLAKTLSMEMERGNPRSRRRLETQILHFDGGDWRGYTYQWNDEQTDAALVPAAGANRSLQVRDPQAPGGKRKQTWHFPARAECVQCHNGWAGSTLAFAAPQLNRLHDFSGTRANQLEVLEQAGFITFVKNKQQPDKPRPALALTDPRDSASDLNLRARSYLHVNCSHCHQFGAGGTADLDLRYETALEQTKTLGVRPVQGAFGIAGANIISPGAPYRSALLYRLAKLGPGRMPHIGSDVTDENGLNLIHDWIQHLPCPNENRIAINGEKIAIDGFHGTAGPDSDAPDKKKIDQFLASTSGALELSFALGSGRIPENLRPAIMSAAIAHSDAQVRDLFERFLPHDQRIQRLGTAIRPEQILALKGDASRGRDLFFKSAGLQCANCHRVAGQGNTLGPDLTSIGKKYGRAQILESILEPSKSIEPAYLTYLLETKDGQIHTGLLAQKTPDMVLLKLVGDKEVRIPAKEVQMLVPQKNSLMPELLLRDLTVQQAADLVDFLAGLK